MCVFLSDWKNTYVPIGLKTNTFVPYESMQKKKGLQPSRLFTFIDARHVTHLRLIIRILVPVRYTFCTLEHRVPLGEKIGKKKTDRVLPSCKQHT